MLLVYSLIGVVLVALAIAIYSGTGGRAWFGTRESPDQIVGRSVQLSEIDGFGRSQITPPSAVVTDCNVPHYRLEFARAFVVDGREESFAWVRPRHVGYPVSGAAHRPTFVYGSLESGYRFTARLTVTDSTPSFHGQPTA